MAPSAHIWRVSLHRAAPRRGRRMLPERRPVVLEPGVRPLLGEIVAGAAPYPDATRAARPAGMTRRRAGSRPRLGGYGRPSTRRDVEPELRRGVPAGQLWSTAADLRLGVDLSRAGSSVERRRRDAPRAQPRATMTRRWLGSGRAAPAPALALRHDGASRSRSARASAACRAVARTRARGTTRSRRSPRRCSKPSGRAQPAGDRARPVRPSRAERSPALASDERTW